jgi:FkbM family methyltransferase
MGCVRTKIFNTIHNCFPRLLYEKASYSQDGEDMLLQSYYETKKNYKGFYVDIGAHHPYRFSNTAYFYKKGWRGINVEPSPTLFHSFQKHRKKDININAGVSSGNVSMPFYVFNDQALNTFDEKIAKERDSNNDRYKIVLIIDIQTCTLKDILENHLPKNQNIDFLTIDVEGLDLAVLKSNDWNKFQPEFILVECDADFDNYNQDETFRFLKEQNYKMVGRTKRSSLFKQV